MNDWDEDQDQLDVVIGCLSLLALVIAAGAVVGVLAWFALALREVIP